MSGPYPPNHGIGSAGPPGTGPPAGYPGSPIAGYPGLLPPPPHPPRSRRGLIAGLAVAAALLTALAAFTGYAVRGATAARAGGVISQASAKTAIQGYLTALLDRDIDTVARHSLCGVYDGVSDRRSDDEVATMSSDAFRKQFSQAEVTSVDMVVHLSDVQAQALFTMRVTRVSGDQHRDRIQGIAQLLSADGDVLVCSFALRTAGTL
ncbi:MAG TPA: hypothetical protein VFR27_18650 [Mycobacterium sp.]|nr:hypothetical protein [Mycobacterium sp.]